MTESAASEDEYHFQLMCQDSESMHALATNFGILTTRGLLSSRAQN